MAYGLAIAAAYVELMLAGAWPWTTSRRGCRSTSPAGGKIFEEVAKFRAGRRLYARMMRERFGARDPRVLDVP